MPNLGLGFTQTFQNALIKEYPLNDTIPDFRYMILAGLGNKGP